LCYLPAGRAIYVHVLLSRFFVLLSEATICGFGLAVLREAAYAECVQVRGLRGVFVSDRDGVPILCHSLQQPTLSPVSSGKKAGQAAPLDGAFALSAEQISRLQLGQCQTMCAVYEDGIVMHVNANPLVLTLVGDGEADVKEIMAVAPRIQSALVPLQETIDRAIRSD
jgi:hypothetical protein